MQLIKQLSSLLKIQEEKNGQPMIPSIHSKNISLKQGKIKKKKNFSAIQKMSKFITTDIKYPHPHPPQKAEEFPSGRKKIISDRNKTLYK